MCAGPRSATARDGWRIWVHPHRFRHRLGSRLVNEGIPLSVIQRVLDHDSIEMTARYAHLDDATVKREMASFHERVNIRGERIALPTGGPLEEAAWMKERIARAKQALPQRVLRAAARAELPAPERVPELRQLPHRQLPHRQLLPRSTSASCNTPRRCATALARTRTCGWSAVEADERSLQRILESLDAIEADNATESASADFDVIELAARRNAKGKELQALERPPRRRAA